MKLLFDQNLSFRLAPALDDLFPGSTQVRLEGLDQADDAVIWRYAAEHDFCIVSLDADFAQMSALHGSPPKIVWLRCGNQPTASVEGLIRSRSLQIIALEATANLDCLEIA